MRRQNSSLRNRGDALNGCGHLRRDGTLSFGLIHPVVPFHNCNKPGQYLSPLETCFESDHLETQIDAASVRCGQHIPDLCRQDQWRLIRQSHPDELALFEHFPGRCGIAVEPQLCAPCGDIDKPAAGITACTVGLIALVALGIVAALAMPDRNIDFQRVRDLHAEIAPSLDYLDALRGLKDDSPPPVGARGRLTVASNTNLPYSYLNDIPTG